MSEEKSRISIIYVAFLEYMGVKGSDKWTKEELQAVSSNFNNWWIKNYEPKNISEIQRMEDGTITLTIIDCSTAIVEYNIPSIAQQGTIPIQRVASDNIVLCEALTGESE